MCEVRKSFWNNWWKPEKVHAMMLPMSAGNLTSGGYHMSQLLNGNLGGYVRKEYLGGA